MADKEKRLRKILVKLHIRGLLESVKTLEESHLVLIEYEEGPSVYSFYEKEGYQEVLDKGYIFPENRVHFLVPSNPRNQSRVVRSIMSSKYGSTYRM